MDRYLRGDLSAPTEEMLAKTEGAPLNNIQSERILGLGDHQLRRAPNATIGYIEGKLKFVSGKTMKWLDKEHQSQILKFARTEGRKLKQKMAVQSVALQKEIIQRKRVVGQKKIKSERKKEEKKVTV